MIGHCSRCRGEVWVDPLEEVWWCACPAGSNPLMGTNLSPAAEKSLWDGVRRRRKDYVDPDAEEDAELDVVVPPEVEMFPLEPDAESLPATARRLAAKAIEHGWDVALTYSRGTPVGKGGKSVPVTYREYLFTEAGQPLMGPPSKKTRKQQQKYQIVSTGEPQVIDVVVLRLHRDGERLFASWEDGRLDLCLRAAPLTILNNTTIKELITS